MTTSATYSKIYKYQPFNQYSLVNLIKRQLYFSTPEYLNDPYDCDPPFEISKAHRTQKNIRLLFEKIKTYEIGKLKTNASKFDQLYLTHDKPNRKFQRDFIDSFKPIKEQIKSRVGVTCFSKRVDNFLLWSHYTEKHQGFCLEFDANILLRDYNGVKIYNVIYPKSNKPIRFNILDILNNSERLSEILLTRKSYHWHYEEELRIICNTSTNTTFPYSENAITGVYFGCNMSEEYKDVITSILANKSTSVKKPDLSVLAQNYPNLQIAGTQICAFNMKLTRDVFKVKPYPYRPQNKYK